jgi:hypothetical protein
MHPNGVNLKDVWTDIPPVRHRKFKSDQRQANTLSTKLVERVIELSTLPGDSVLDPFGGSGTTYAVCEQRHRHWIGIELESCDPIIARLKEGDVRNHRNEDFVEKRFAWGSDPAGLTPCRDLSFPVPRAPRTDDGGGHDRAAVRMMHIEGVPWGQTRRV